jgi:hypothetical protein
MLEECSIRNNQGYFPSRIVHTFFEGFIAQTGPTLHESRHFFRSVFPTVTGWSGTDQNRSDAVTFYIIIDSVTGRNREKLHTGISPYRSIVFSILGTYTFFSDFEV